MIKQKILKKIKQKQAQLINIQNNIKKIDEIDNQQMNEEFKLINNLNPFHKRKWKPQANLFLKMIASSEEKSLKKEIEELKELLQ